MLAAEPDVIQPDSFPPAKDGRSLASLSGIGGRLTLWPDRIEIERHGVFFSLLNLGFHVEREIGSTIYLRELVGVHLVRSLLLVQFLRFTYAGCPTPSGRYLRDAFAENAYMLSLRDNRPLLAFMRRIDAAIAGLPRR
ncbi:MAG: hypothetical protein JWR10_3481 [Rubritepida sp.]|nr:hypothetical protein [Rubritepida sp.]